MEQVINSHKNININKGTAYYLIVLVVGIVLTVILNQGHREYKTITNMTPEELSHSCVSKEKPSSKKELVGLELWDQSK